MPTLINKQDAIKTTWDQPSYTNPLNVLTEVRDKLKALPEVRYTWNPCSKKLPQIPNSYPATTRKKYLVTLKDGDIAIMYFDFDTFNWESNDTAVIAWMDLPSKYIEARRNND